MARISTYSIDPNITADDKWIGTDFNTQYTKNFTPQYLADFFNISNSIGVSGQMSFKYYSTFPSGRPEESITTPAVNPNFSAVTSFKIHKNSGGGNYCIDFINYLSGDEILISDTSNADIFGHFKLNSVIQDLSETNFYNLNVTYIGGNGNLQHLKVYSIALYSAAITNPPIPNLQQVTTAGAITTDAITVAGIYSGNLYSDGFSFGISDNYDTNYNLLYLPYSGLQITNSLDYVYIYQDASIGFQNFAGGYGNLRSDFVTGSWSWQLPDASGTLALTSNIGTWGALNYPTWTTGTPFVKMTAAGTFALDTNTYLTTTAAASTYYPIPTGTISQYIRGDGTFATFPTITIPTLQQVTTAGNTTTNSILIENTAVSPLSVFLINNGISLVDTSTGKSVAISTNNDIGFIGAGSSSLYLKSPVTISGTNTQTLQNASGTIALLSDVGVTSVTATSPITSSGGATPDISTSMATNKLIGRSTAGVGVMEEITIGTGLTLTGGTLNASATGGIPHATASGTDTYTATITGVTAYNDADSYLIRFTNGNTTGATLNINGLGAIPLYRNNDGPLLGGDILAGGEMLCIYNSTLVEFQVIGISPNSLIAYVTNDDSVTLTKGMPVYAFSGQGDRMTVMRANNTGDATSAQTVGLVMSTSIAANQKGVIMMQGLLDGLSILPTATWNDGDSVYLGATDGSITNIKPHAPNHLVYLGVVTTASNGAAGRMYVRVQNGYELDELHNVQAQSPSLNDTLWYDNTVSPAQWKTASIPTILGYTPPNLGLVQAMTQGLQNIF